LLGGSILALAGVLRLGSNLTPLPYPKSDATLVETGPYALVRHPIYSGLILAAFGWALFVHGWLTLSYAIVLLIFFDVKSRIEERWLSEKFTGYAKYRKRIRKLIPWVY
jgi:protein-S-isoprenylcysteine O-methyltransferase Ste14